MKPLDSFNTIHLSTKTNIIFNGVAANTLAGFLQPPTDGSYMKVTVSGGTNNTGTVTFNTTTETLTFTAADWQISSNKYTTLSAITTSGLANETVKPTVKIEAVDMAGSPINWSSSASYPCQFFIIKNSQFARAQLGAQGLKAPSYYRVRIAYEVEIYIGQEFTIDGQLQTYIIWEEPIRHMQLGTDLVDYIEFVATIKK